MLTVGCHVATLRSTHSTHTCILFLLIRLYCTGDFFTMVQILYKCFAICSKAAAVASFYVFATFCYFTNIPLFVIFLTYSLKKQHSAVLQFTYSSHTVQCISQFGPVLKHQCVMMLWYQTICLVYDRKIESVSLF